jgi:hypothetical protein
MVISLCGRKAAAETNSGKGNIMAKGFGHEDFTDILAVAEQGTDVVSVKFDGAKDNVHAYVNGEATDNLAEADSVSFTFDNLTAEQVDAIMAVLRRAKGFASKAKKGEVKMVTMKRRKPRGAKVETRTTAN